MTPPLDDVDRGILYLLQRDARNTTAQEMAERVGVSASTVRNRIEALEESGVVDGYIPAINYEAADFPLRVMFVITAAPTDRSEFVDRLLGIRGVIAVREMITGHRNVHVEVIGTDTEDITRITDAIHELGVTIESSEIMKQSRVQPFDHFHMSDDKRRDILEGDESDQGEPATHN